MANQVTMYFISKKFSLIFLGITSVLCARAMFALLNDPEGPNLLVVMVMGVIVYVLTLVIYTYDPSTKSLFYPFSLTPLVGRMRMLMTMVVQIIIVTVFYFFLV